jgi:hypothetical protein
MADDPTLVNDELATTINGSVGIYGLKVIAPPGGDDDPAKVKLNFNGAQLVNASIIQGTVANDQISSPASVINKAYADAITLKAQRTYLRKVAYAADGGTDGSDSHKLYFASPASPVRIVIPDHQLPTGDDSTETKAAYAIYSEYARNNNLIVFPNQIFTSSDDLGIKLPDINLNAESGEDGLADWDRIVPTQTIMNLGSEDVTVTASVTTSEGVSRSGLVLGKGGSVTLMWNGSRYMCTTQGHRFVKAPEADPDADPDKETDDTTPGPQNSTGDPYTPP